jgi:uncharacterized membrane protein YdjX (TVP38/TMEM64 family)
MSISIEAPRETRARWRWVMYALAAAALAALIFFLWSAWDHDAFLAWLRQARPRTFFAALAILPALGVPMTPFFMLAGATFGARLGLVGSLLALATNLTLCYAVARSGVRPWIASFLRRFDYELPDFAERRKGSVRFTLLVKLAPGVPAFAKHYALGVAGVRFAVYFFIAMLITGLYAAALVVLGESVLDHNVDRSIGAAAIVAVLALGLWWWGRRRARARRARPA